MNDIVFPFFMNESPFTEELLSVYCEDLGINNRTIMKRFSQDCIKHIETTNSEMI